VPLGAPTKPPGLVTRNGMVMGPTTLVTELPRDRQPACSMSSPGPGNSVGNLVEEHLVDVVIFCHGAEVSRHGDSFFRVITSAETGFGVVEPERPRGVEVKSN